MPFSGGLHPSAEVGSCSRKRGTHEIVVGEFLADSAGVECGRPRNARGVVGRGRRLEQREERLGQKEHALDVGVHDLVPPDLGELAERFGPATVDRSAGSEVHSPP